ncbi:MAG: hypothetical protein H3C54_15175 [Taibaiella sp.]|nr:hypothetical protein [Taibaiella sp.]
MPCLFCKDCRICSCARNILCDNDIFHQTIRLVHETNNRAAFGLGIIFGAKYLINKPNGLYSMDRIIREECVNNIS